MTPALLPSITVDITPHLFSARAALKALANQSSFRDYIARAISKGPCDDLNRREREGKSHFKILYVRGNGFEAPLGTYLVLSIPHEAIGMPRFETALKLHVRFTGKKDGFEKTRLAKSEEFRAKLSLCSDPEYLEKLILSTFG